MTLDNWSDLFAAVSPHAPMTATLYFVCFILLGTMIMLNLFIGVITNSMAEIHAELDARQSALEIAKPQADRDVIPFSQSETSKLTTH